MNAYLLGAPDGVDAQGAWVSKEILEVTVDESGATPLYIPSGELDNALRFI